LTKQGGDDDEGLDKDWTPSEPLRPHTDLDNLVPVALLGRGSFGRVHLVIDSEAQAQVRKQGTINGPQQHIYALKCLIRSHVVRNGWQAMVENERSAMLELSAQVRSPFILNCYNTFVDEKNCYFLLEVCRGGDFYQLICSRPEHMLTEDEAKFFIGSVVLGLSAMHERSILYRDLKPENIMITESGYVKLADFGLCKKTLRTFTVCGTPGEFFFLFLLLPCDLSVVVLLLTIKRMVPACSYAQCVFNDRQCLRHSHTVGSLVANRATLH
jgi:serine/threonine protein kinase